MFNKHIYGPVPSRRLGRSLGVDIIPFKFCTYDCIYCQLGHSTEKTINRKEFYKSSLILKELERFRVVSEEIYSPQRKIHVDLTMRQSQFY